MLRNVIQAAGLLGVCCCLFTVNLLHGTMGLVGFLWGHVSTPWVHLSPWWFSLEFCPKGHPLLFPGLVSLGSASQHQGLLV